MLHSLIRSSDCAIGSRGEYSREKNQPLQATVELVGRSVLLYNFLLKFCRSNLVTHAGDAVSSAYCTLRYAWPSATATHSLCLSHCYDMAVALKP